MSYSNRPATHPASNDGSMTKSLSKPLVGIGLPVYNGERYITETLNSLLAQTFDDFELIICDNASTDKTQEICCTYAAADVRIRYIRNATNLGAAMNYRRAFELSSGKYFRWANCDDLFAPESLARCIEILDRDSSVVLTYPKTKLIDDHGQVISDYDDGLHLQAPKASVRLQMLDKRLGLVNAIYGLMRRDILRRAAPIGNYPGSDICLLAELTLYGTFWEIPEFLFYRRLHAGAYSSLKDARQQIAFYDPTRKHRVFLRTWRHLWERFRAVKRAPLNADEKLRLYCYLGRTLAWSRAELLRELSAAISHLLRSSSSSA